MKMTILARAAVLAACLLLAPTLAFAYGGGGGDVGRSRGSGSGATIGSASAYETYCSGVSDREPVKAEATAAAEDAWEGLESISPATRRLALVLDAMVLGGDLTFDQAKHVLLIFVVGDYQRNPQAWQSRPAPAPEDDAPGAASRYTHNPENRQSLDQDFNGTAPAATTTPAEYANAINNHQSAVAAFNDYVQSHGHPASIWTPEDEEHASLLVSTFAWDETLSVPDSVRQLAVVLESQVASGAITPRNAYTMLMAQVAGTGAQVFR